MLGRLKGKPEFIEPGKVLIDVNGVGYLVNISYNTYYQITEKPEVQLHIHTYVKEDALNLYGFYNQIEKELFIKFISISGIGPKLAINILSGIPTDELINAIENGSVERLQAVPGVGRKTAERISIEMRDKIKQIFKDKNFEIEVPSSPDTQSSVKTNVISALINLGYKSRDAEQAVIKSLAINDSEPSLEDVLKDSLKYLSGGI